MDGVHGVAESELLGWRWMDVLHPDDREKYSAILDGFGGGARRL